MSANLPAPVANVLGLEGAGEMAMPLTDFYELATLGFVASVGEDYAVRVRVDDEALVLLTLRRPDGVELHPQVEPIRRVPDLTHAGFLTDSLSVHEPGLFAVAATMRRLDGTTYWCFAADGRGAWAALLAPDVFAAFTPDGHGLIGRLSRCVRALGEELGGDTTRALVAALALEALAERAGQDAGVGRWWVCRDDMVVFRSESEAASAPARLNALRHAAAVGLARDLSGRARLDAPGSTRRVFELERAADERAERLQWTDPTGDLAGSLATLPLLSDALQIATVAEAVEKVSDELKALGITERQADVLVRLMAGETAEEIAGVLGVAPKTVYAHQAAAVETLRKICLSD